MTEVEPGDTPAQERVGDRLRQAREAQGLSLAEIGSRTRVPLRHLEAIETTDFGILPSPTYAIGFARAYARAVGLDDSVVAREVRDELSQVPRAPEYQPYETADPARVPSRGIAILGLGLAIALLVLAGLYYATDLFRPGAGGGAGGIGGTSVAVAPPTVSAPVTAAPLPSPTPATGPVTLTAGTNEVWLRVYDAANTTLYLGTLKPGENFVVPANANGPKINVGRPDELRVAVGGTAIPPLGDGSRAIKDVAIDAASLLARTATGGAAATPAVTRTVGAPLPQAPAAELVETRPAAARPAAARPAPRPSPARRVLTETQRANLQSANNPPPPANATDR